MSKSVFTAGVSELCTLDIKTEKVPSLLSKRSGLPGLGGPLVDLRRGGVAVRERRVARVGDRQEGVTRDVEELPAPPRVRGDVLQRT